ncbi:MAG: hypothetical protein JWN30_2520 [Bacilli bacterium]|nr:hypothetical protein [Bacilli bacterium]
MEEDLISKKDLLELTDISYGQLYRWKRKNLIPEQWFIRKSTFTGQETFFPKQDILARIDRIKNMKEDLSLDELADMFSPVPTEISLAADDLLKRNIVSEVTLKLYDSEQGKTEWFSFAKALNVYIVDKLLQTGEMSLDEGKNLLQTLVAHFPNFEGKPCELIFVRKMGVSAFLLTAAANEIYFDQGVRVISRLPIAHYIEELKLKMMQEAPNGTQS